MFILRRRKNDTKINIILVGGAICLLGVTSAMAIKYNEAPMLRVRVAAGELPPVEERLPEEPLVIKPIEEVGQYGGTLYSCAIGRGYLNEMDVLRSTLGFRLSLDMKTILPNLFKDWSFSKDCKTFTLYLRKGVKWSDGMPFTADDFLFWWEDIMLNKDLNPSQTIWFAPTLVNMEKVDDYTVRYHFSKPFRPIVNALAIFQAPQGCFFELKHYLKKFHIKYNLQANELAKEAGYDYWWQLFRLRRTYIGGDDPSLPSLGPWVLKEVTPTQFIYERNPYYWAVDTSGNQLPYIDTIVVDLVSNIEVENMKVMSGEVDFKAWDLTLENYPLYKENAEKGNYRVLLWKSTRGSECAYAFNLNTKDPILREIFQDVRFRHAMSLAINREEINEMVFLGKGVPRQATCHPNCSYYEEKWAKSYAEYNPEEANRLLDEMGLDKRDDAGYRLRPDGKTLELTLNYVPGETPKGPVTELVREYWQDVGVKVNIKPVERSYWFTRLSANEYNVAIWHFDDVAEHMAYALPRKFCPLWWSPLNWAPEWGKWYIHHGEQGEEPPQVVKRLFNLVTKWQSCATDEEYTLLAKKIWDLEAENTWVVGTVGLARLPVVAKNNLRNLPEEAWFGDSNTFWKSMSPEQWFFRKAE